MEEERYLTVAELSSRIKISKQTIYNLIYQKKFILGRHYYKPLPKKILFIWPAIQAWLGESPSSDDKSPSDPQKQAATPANSRNSTTQEKPNSLINI